MPNILVSRLFLNLKTFDEPKDGFTTSSLPSPVFAQDRWLGNIGAPLNSGSWDREEGSNGEVGPMDAVTASIGADALTTLVPVVSWKPYSLRI